MLKAASPVTLISKMKVKPELQMSEVQWMWRGNKSCSWPPPHMHKWIGTTVTWERLASKALAGPPHPRVAGHRKKEKMEHSNKISWIIIDHCRDI